MGVTGLGPASNTFDVPRARKFESPRVEVSEQNRTLSKTLSETYRHSTDCHNAYELVLYTLGELFTESVVVPLYVQGELVNTHP